jgi:hypothetical protein
MSGLAIMVGLALAAWRLVHRGESWRSIGWRRPVHLGHAAIWALGMGTPGMRLLGKVLAFAAFLTLMLALACVVFAFGVDFE